MDTRNKIISAAEAAPIAASGAIVVSGYFDPVVASHAARLTEIKGDRDKLIVLIAEPENPILPNRARAELVAGLSIVDYVVDGGTGEMVSGDAGLTPQTQLEQEDTARRQQLIAHVHARQAAK